MIVTVIRGRADAQGRRRAAAISGVPGSDTGSSPDGLTLLSLQRLAGNTAVARLIGHGDDRRAPLALPRRRPDQAVVQLDHRRGDPAPVPSLPDPTAAAATPFEATHKRLVDNDLVAPVVYRYRERMLRRFVAWHRALEMRELPADQQAAAIQQALDHIRAERDHLAGLETQTRADRRLQQDLDRRLARAERSTARALDVAAGWTHEHGGDDLSGPALENEVRRLGTAMSLPSWEITTILDYGGMRYGRSRAESGGAPTAHGSYFAPQRLLWAIETVRTGQTVPPEQANAFMHLDEAEALGRLQAMHSAGAIPDRFWRLIVYRTDLRLDTTDTAWNDINARAAAPANDEQRRSADTWRRIMSLWTSGTRVPGARGGVANVRGLTGWRTEMYRRRGVVALGVVCNELAEAIANQRGIDLPGGITANARTFATDSASSGAGTTATGRYFGRVDAGHLVPGANLFFLKANWQLQGHPWDWVTAVPGVEYPQRLDPGQKGTAPTSPLPASPDARGWTYTVADGQPITRTKRAAGPPNLDGTFPETREWMTWQHEATVAEIHGGSVYTLETTGVPRPDGHGGGAGAGINARSLASLTGNPGIFLGVDAGAARPAAGAAGQETSAGSGPGTTSGPGTGSASAGSSPASDQPERSVAPAPSDVEHALASGRQGG